MRAVAAVPSEPATVYLATGERVYKSVDAGAHWTPTALAGSFNVLLTTSMPSVVYASFRNQSGLSTVFSSRPLHRTTDGGETWRILPAPPGPLLSTSRDDPLTLYTASASRLFRTTNGGESWEPFAELPAGTTYFLAIAFSPADSAEVYAAAFSGTGFAVYRSSNRGGSWTRTGLREAVGTLVFDPRDSSRVFALANDGLYMTANRGGSWRRLTSAPVVPTYIAFDPEDSRRLYYLSGGRVFSSGDGGETANPLEDPKVRQDVSVLTVSASSVVLAGSTRGIVHSRDGGETWSASNHGILGEVPVTALAIDPTNPAFVFAGTTRGVYGSRDGGGSWNAPNAGSPAANVVAVDRADPSTLYAAGDGVHRSTDGGETWADRSPQGLARYIAALVIDPSNPRRIFASNQEVFRTLDGTENWDLILKAEDTVASYYYPPAALALAIAPSANTTIYAAGATAEWEHGFVARSDDGGTTWSTPITLSRVVQSLAVDPCDPQIVYAGGYWGVSRSADGGMTWSEPRGPGVIGSSLVVDPRQSTSLFAGGLTGLFWSNDSGATWARFEPALQIPVYSLAIDSTGRFLHAGTSDGVFDLERTFEPCAAGGKRLCLLGSRYELAVTARDPRTGTAEPVEGQGIADGDRFGYFSFPALTGDAVFPEVFVKMADATGQPAPYGGNVWVFHTSVTDLDYTLVVRDTFTGRVRTYQSQKYGHASGIACGQADTRAFDGACSERPLSAPASGIRSDAVSSPALSLLGGRFRATLRATDPRTGHSAEGEAVPRADGFGYFSLPGFTGDPGFPEVFVKMTDATALPGGSFWVFHTGLTDVEYTLTVTDQATSVVKTYGRGAPAGAEHCGDADTSAFRN